MKKSRWVVVLIAAVLCLSLLGPASIAGAQEAVTLTVTVETPAGEPVSNAELTATWDGGSSTATTGENGQARFAIESPGKHEITVVKGDLTSDTHTVTGVEADGTETTVGDDEETESPGQPGFVVVVAGFVALVGAVRLFR